MLETLDYTIRIGSTPTILYFDLYLYSAYAAHYVYFVSERIGKLEVYSIVFTLSLTNHILWTCMQNWIQAIGFADED